MSPESELTAASTDEQCVAVLKITLLQLASTLCRWAYDEGLPQPFRIKFKDQSRLQSRIAELDSWCGAVD